jgi:hypothetical protein
MNLIESYSFGRMVINGTLYTKDVIIMPDNSILSPWWRRRGHVLTVDDLRDLLAQQPKTIICGTGAMGVMRPAAELKDYLEAHNIEFIIQKSSWAVEIYNSRRGEENLGACFHLTC